MENNSNSQEKKESDYQKVSLKEFFSISWWVTKLLFKMFPFHATVYLIGEILINLRELGSAYLFALLVDELIRVAGSQTRDISQVYPAIWLFMGFELLSTIVRYVYRTSHITIRQEGRVLTRKAFYYKLKELGIQTLEQPDINNKIHRSDSYLTDIYGFFFQQVALFAYVLRTIATIGLVISMTPWFVVFLFLIYIPIFFFDKTMRSRMYKFDFDTTEDGRVAGETVNALMNTQTLPEVYITQAFDFLDKKYQDISLWLVSTRLRLLNRWRFGGHTYSLVLSFAVVYASLGIMKKALAGVISVGQVTFWMRTLFTLNSSVDMTLSYFNDLLEMSLRYKDIYSIFNTEPAIKDGSIAIPRLHTGPSIEFKNMSFKYPNTDKFILKDLDLRIKPEQKIAIVGYNGAGKTTLVKLLCRFYQPTEGKILINDTDLSEIEIDSLYKNMGVLFQEFNRYPQLTVTENIQLGNSKVPASEQRIKAAAESADSQTFIDSYKNKFGQILSERYKNGIRPSTGQWQKLAIARFFYRNAPLVIFDEPTAAIDAVSEYNIFNNIYHFFKGKTVIIISHKFSTVRNADRILVLDKGSIVEDGSHDELMRLDGFYARSFRLQAEGYRETTESLVS